jgi:hypothetical protein
VAYTGEAGKEDLKTAQKLRKKLSGLWISSDRIVMDDGDSFLAVYGEDHHDCGKKDPVGIAGNLTH